MKPAYHCVLNDGQEVYVREDALTPAERADVEERMQSREARRQFGIALRAARRAEDAPEKAALKIMASKPLGQQNLTAAEIATVLSGAPRHVKKSIWANEMPGANEIHLSESDRCEPRRAIRRGRQQLKEHAE